MTMFFSKPDFEQVKAFVVLSVALKLRVQDAEITPSLQLVEIIEQANSSLGADLSSFLRAYDAWYAFHEQLDAEGKLGMLDARENTTLIELIETRDRTRSTLLASLANFH
jgi:hypothetical protein